mmetsp:Transcript_2971/g.4586  ORF Transcript_2971/g.4586 Transcript_2971/m.4586 type:complete len:780 (+) Transcript_2971:187-2526(+)
MGFEFGVVTELDFTVTLYCFIIIILFVIVFEYLIGIMEYFLEGSKLFSEMIQMIYKELMLMGLVTFCVIMYEATTAGGVSEGQEHWISGIDFSHVYLFFVTVFFVIHAFYLMAMSSSAASEYRGKFTEKTVDLISSLEKLRDNPISAGIFRFKLLPLSDVRTRVEFSLLHSLFLKTYLLPEEFDFPYYLSGCFGQFALRTIERSMFTWVVLLLVVVLNFARIKLGFSCGAIEDLEEDARRRQLEEGEEEEGSEECVETMVYIFLACGVVLILYSVILTVITRIYKTRLVDRIYPGHDTMDDYLGLLRSKQRTAHHDPLKPMRMTREQLKKEIEIEFDEEEGEVEDEEGIIFLAESLYSVYRFVNDSISDLELYIRVTISDCFNPNKEKEQIEQGILFHAEEEDSSGGGGAPMTGQSSISSVPQASVTETRKEYVPLKHRLMVASLLKDKMRDDGVTVQPMLKAEDIAAAQEKTPGGEENKSDAETAEMQKVLEAYRAASLQAATAAKAAGDGCCCSSCGGLTSCCSCLPCCAEEEEDPDSADFNSIYLWGKPLYFFRAVEMQLMFTCMYMGMWATNFIPLVMDDDIFDRNQQILYQVLMIIPILVAFNRVAFIAETSSLILAISHIDIEVMYDVLVATEDMELLTNELRGKILDKIKSWAGGKEDPDEEQQKLFVHKLFIEVDQDGSGAIDKGEFRQMLRKLNLTYSDHRFNLLFRAVDSIGGDGVLEEEELTTFMFPPKESEGVDADADAADALGRFQGGPTNSNGGNVDAAGAGATK